MARLPSEGVPVPSVSSAAVSAVALAVALAVAVLTCFGVLQKSARG